MASHLLVSRLLRQQVICKRDSRMGNRCEQVDCEQCKRLEALRQAIKALTPKERKALGLKG